MYEKEVFLVVEEQEIEADIKRALQRGSDTLNYKNYGISEDDLPLLVECLNTTPQITTLNLAHNNIIKSEELQKLSHIKKLDISYNNLRDENAVLLASSTLESVDLTFNCLTDKFLEAFKDAKHMRHIVHRDTPNAKVSQKKLKALNEALKAKHKPSQKNSGKHTSQLSNTNSKYRFHAPVPLRPSKNGGYPSSHTHSLTPPLKG